MLRHKTSTKKCVSLFSYHVYVDYTHVSYSTVSFGNIQQEMNAGPNPQVIPQPTDALRSYGNSPPNNQKNKTYTVLCHLRKRAFYY